jgi:hypothetical protein
MLAVERFARVDREGAGHSHYLRERRQPFHR